MTVQEAQKKYDEALAKYNKSHTHKDWVKLNEAQEELNQAITEMMKGV